MACEAEMQSLQDPTHIHICGGEHDAGDHMCCDPKCRRWFWQNPKPTKPKRVRPRRDRK